ncbi:MAG: hypothetical protein LBB60_08520 [Desulfovibrio sp.]|jgi:hypothetical protein|nr:hypothetical protein [Desulfovibrio sp.]
MVVIFSAWLYTARMMVTAQQPLKVIVSLDVEEEGLFSGRYASSGCTVRNVQLLPRLAPLTQELGFPLTLFCTHTVFADPNARSVLTFMRERCNAEIGAHLHHWSTPPPHESDKITAPTRTDQMPRDLLQRRLEALLHAGQNFLGSPVTSFRMGRWDLKSVIRPLLTEHGIKLDSSVCPLRAFTNGPDHFLAPADPYWVDGLLEAPITQVAICPPLARLWHKIAPQQILDSFCYWGVASANPLWHYSGVMRLAARLHVRRGGKVLSLFWHSSEMMPGASPHIKDEDGADRLFKKIYNYLIWLKETFPVQGVTATRLYNDAPALQFAQCPPQDERQGDW